MNGRLKSLFGLFLLALAFLAPVSADAANRFWVGGTGTWDSTTTTHWASSSGGASGASAPVAGDNITFDGSSGGGTVTPDGTIAGIAFNDLTAGAFTGTLAFNTNNPNVTFRTVSFTGTATRNINMGSGIWTITGGNGFVGFDVTTTTGLTPTFSNATLSFTGCGASRRSNFGTSQSFGPVVIGNCPGNSGVYSLDVTTASTFASLTVGSGNAVMAAQGTTLIVSGATAITGTSSAPSALQANLAVNNVATVSMGSASTCDWCSIVRITRSGAGSFTATNSLDLGGNNTGASFTITPPSSGGSCPGRIIGGENRFQSPIPSRGQKTRSADARDDRLPLRLPRFRGLRVWKRDGVRVGWLSFRAWHCVCD